MSCFGLKGGIGSASRLVRHTPAATLHRGRAGAGQLRPPLALTLLADASARRWRAACGSRRAGGRRGSIIMLVATDAPLDARQLRRIAVRAGAGLARTGSVFGHGSGDIALAFSTAYTVPQKGGPADCRPWRCCTRARSIRCSKPRPTGTEQAIVHALFAPVSVTGRDGHHRSALTDLAPDLAR
jgi:D-aminopeptidase